MSRMKVKDAYCLHIRYTCRLKNAGYQLCVLTDKLTEKVFDNKSLKLNNLNNFAPIFKIQTATCF